MSSGFVKLPELKNWPDCAVCHKPVDCLYQFENPADFGFKIAVECHGRREVVSIPYDVLKDCDGDIRLGLAFAVEAASLLPSPSADSETFTVYTDQPEMSLPIDADSLENYGLKS